MKRGEREDRREAAELNALTEGIIGAAIKVHRELGPGLLEPAYEACLHFEPGQRLSGGLASRPSALTAFSALESSLLPRAGVLFPGQRSKPVNVHFDTEAMTSDEGSGECRQGTHALAVGHPGEALQEGPRADHPPPQAGLQAQEAVQEGSRPRASRLGLRQVSEALGGASEGGQRCPALEPSKA